MVDLSSSVPRGGARAGLWPWAGTSKVVSVPGAFALPEPPMALKASTEMVKFLPAGRLEKVAVVAPAAAVTL